MRPDPSMVTISDNTAKIKDFILNAILRPRAIMHKWSTITTQTPNVKIGYTGQHLASLITGVRGTATGARGEDVADGTEVKSCCRVDQVDTCKGCKKHVMRYQTSCPHCSSQNIKRNNDSKWLIAIRKESELNLYLKEIPRTFFLLFDYPDFDKGDFDTLRIASYEIWNQSNRASVFRQLLNDYYYNIYLAHKKANPKSNPAPKNFWPYSYQFYLCNPIKTFECIIHDSIKHPEININLYVDPKADRSQMASEDMPVDLLSPDETDILAKHKIIVPPNGTINEQAKTLLPVRDEGKSNPQEKEYHRKHQA